MALNWRPIVKLSIISLNQQDHAAGVRGEIDGNRGTKPQAQITWIALWSVAQEQHHETEPSTRAPFNFRFDQQQPTCIIRLHAYTRISSSSLLCSRRTTCNPLFNRIVARSTRARYNASQASIETLSACGQTVSGGARYDYARFPTIISPASNMITHTHPRMSNGCNAN